MISSVLLQLSFMKEALSLTMKIMKKSLFYLFALICSMSLFTSCSDDDDDVDFSTVIEGEIAGVYKGTMDVYYEDPELIIAKDMIQKITIKKSSNTSVGLELKDFTITVAGNSLVIGDIAVDNCPLVENNGSYSFSGDANLNLVVGECGISVTGTYNKGKVTMTIKVNVSNGQMKVRVEYDGAKLSGSESTEAKITSFTIDDDIVTVAPVIDDENSTITFKVNDEATEEDLKALVPVIAISEKATVTPASGVAQDFSGAKSVVYTVVSEDGTSRKYTASIEGVQNIMKYSLEEWTEIDGGTSDNYWTPEPAGFLATSNAGAKILNGSSIATKIGYPVMKESEGYNGGAAAKLVTIDARGHALGSMAPVTSGSLFTGKFVLNMFAPLKSTQFGIAYDKEPKLFKGVYKYKAGDNYIDGSKKPIEEGLDIKDQCSIAAILYEAEDANGKEVILTGADINTSDYRVAEARLADGSDKEEWTTFELSFEYYPDKSYDSTKKYKLAIICSSSKEGDRFIGADKSTLIVDELEVVGE